MILLELFVGFLFIGCFSFGSAYAAIPLIREVVLHFGWLDDEMLSYMIAVSESTPGPIMVNMATYIGSSKGGVLGAFIATFAVVMPAFLIVIIITTALKKHIKKDGIRAVLNGLKACVIGIILATGAYMVFTNCLGSVSDFNADIIAIILTAGFSVFWFTIKYGAKKNFSPLILICLLGCTGVLVYGWS